MICSFGILFSCTEKGCRDESALNYQVTANVDDGSCIYCQLEEIDRGALTFTLQDNRSGSLHYNEDIARIKASHIKEGHNDGACGENGCYITLTVESLVPEKMQGLYLLIQFTPQVGNGFSQVFYPNFLNPGETIIVPHIHLDQSINCPNINNGSVTTYLYGVTYL